ncbi:MAG: amidinotransferase [Synergistaceae bacterium]|jgi:N-dimethylarginine dimethylaminohydrolase|nr:amidinotransferase [Synergistaceae bacterium]
MPEKIRDSSMYYHVVLERITPKASPPFEDTDMQERVWGRRWGVYNDAGTLRTVLMHRPGDELRVMTADKYDPTLDALIDDDEQWYFRSDDGPDIPAMQAEHDALARIIADNGAEVVYVDGGPRDPNSMFTRDMGMVVNGGIIISRMGPVGKLYGTGRRGEEAYITSKVAEIGMPILHTIHGEGLMEGGSFGFLNDRTAVISLSARGNKCAVDQVRQVLEVQGINLIEVPLVGFSMHIDGAIVMVDHDKALINVERLPYWFIDKLKELGIEAIYGDYRDISFAVNCLAIKPGVIIMDDLAPRTAEILSAKGIKIITTPYAECRKHGGGIHCSTLPLVRDRD